MKRPYKNILLFATCLLVGCGNLQVVKIAQVPPQVINSTVELSTKRPLREEVAPRAYEVPERSMFLRQTSGGSLTLGLLFGPLGALANAANINRLTSEMGKSGINSNLYTIDALKEAQAAWPTIKLGSANAESLTIKPFILLYVADENSGISTVVSARVESNRRESTEKAKPWVGLYNYVVNGNLPISALQSQLSSDELERYRSSIREGYKEIRYEMESDLSNKPHSKRQIAWVKSSILGIGSPGDIERTEGGRLSLRLNAQNLGALSDPLFSYAVYIFPSAAQYAFDNGPVDRMGN